VTESTPQDGDWEIERRHLDAVRGVLVDIQGAAFATEDLCKADQAATTDYLDQPAPLSAITTEDVAAEGFPDWSIDRFVRFFCATHRGCSSNTEVTRIQWSYPDPQQVPAPDRGRA
jgi:hypothetical protein